MLKDAVFAIIKYKLLSIIFLNEKLDLDQLNHILNVLGSPSQEDLQFIRNEKVGLHDSPFYFYVKNIEHIATRELRQK